MQDLFPNSEIDIANIWIKFAVECVSLEQFVDFTRKGTDEEEIERWLTAIFNKISDIKQEYGNDIASKIYSLLLQRNCLYTLEMEECAEYLKNRGSFEVIKESFILKIML